MKLNYITTKLLLPMGLDQYAYKIKKGIIKSDTPKNFDQDNLTEIGYWRKHPNLEGWMSNLYQEKGGTEKFNCQFIRLSLDDLKQLEHKVLNEELPHTTGSFFGVNSDDIYYHADIMFVCNARLWIEEGYDVLYSSWW